jgi:hypothetical protein
VELADGSYQLICLKCSEPVFLDDFTLPAAMNSAIVHKHHHLDEL